MFHKCSSQPMWVLSIWVTKELTCVLLIWLNVSGICPATIKFLLFSGWFIGSFDVSWKFQWSGVPTSRALTDLESSLSWSYRTCPVWTTRGQRLVFQSLEGREFQRESGVPTVGSFGMCREFWHLAYFNSVTWFSNILRVRSFDMCREFRRLTTSL